MKIVGMVDVTAIPSSKPRKGSKYDAFADKIEANLVKLPAGRALEIEIDSKTSKMFYAYCKKCKPYWSIKIRGEKIYVFRREV